MGVNVQEFVNDKVIGNIKIGKKNEKGNPQKCGYFNVHLDKMTSSLAVELFNEVYDKPDKLKIRFIDQNPMEVHLERYKGNRRVCYGNNREAAFIDDNGKKQRISCNCKKCEFALAKQCKFIGRLYFILDKLEDEGVWCYPTGNQNGISKILKRIARANRIDEDLTKDWYELFLTPEPSSYKGINYVPDIRKISSVVSKTEESELKEKNNNNQKKTSQNNTQKNKNYLMVMNFQKIILDNKEVTKITFKDTDLKEKNLILFPESNQEILSLKQKSIILPISISTQQNVSVLNSYEIIKKAS